MNELQANLFHEDSSFSDIGINSFHPDTTNGQSQALSSYLNSEQSVTYPSQSIQQEQGSKFMRLNQQHYLTCPQIYESYRNESCISRRGSGSYMMLEFSGGRVELFFRDCVQIELKGVATLTHFLNGDYKLSNREMVYFWHEEERILEKYSITV